ncbi:NAD-dependent epimerase/dehydratase family protein [Staphylococcus capitis]|uniref:NAD-dependent epimerase/dehydratase family protein n=1 Tax=Staphylococcus capitis TaxID=29388 RepID=UPI000E69CB7B|nr:NAD-dependent epimerase/dehydratase family protein [Staphylococcus capitis]RIM55579.1 NAD-dependent epimerase/dehydratase family protein [Staphylococcus capitis]
MKALITGGAGFIGSHLAEKLTNEGIDVYIIDNLSTGSLENIPFIDNERFYFKDITDYNFVTTLIKQEQFEYIFHLAAMVSVVETIEKPISSNEINICATINLLESTRKWNHNIKKMIFASSAAVYGDLPDLPKSVTVSKVAPLSPYAIQKYAGEQYTLIYNHLYQVPSVCLRFFNIYGPKQNPNSDYSGVLSILNSKFINRETFTFYGDGKQTRDFVYIDDLISAIWMVANSEKINGSIFNVGNGIQTSLKEVFKSFEDAFGYSIPYSFKEPRLGDIKHSYADITQLKQLGYSPTFTIHRGINAYVTYSKNK